MADAEAILGIVQRMYDAAVTADAWQPALDSVVDLLDGDHAILLARDPAHDDSVVAKSARMDARDFTRFLSPEAARWIEPVMRATPAGAVTTRSHVMTDRDFERTEFYNEVVRPAGGFHGMAVRHERPALSCFISVCRRRQARDFAAKDATALQILSPHFAMALRVRQRLGAADLRTAGAWAALDRLGTGVMIVDAAAAVVFANEAATRLFDDAQSFRIDRRDGLGTTDMMASRKLRRMIAGCCADPTVTNLDASGVIELSRGERQAPLRVVIAPFRPARVGLDAGWSAKPLALLLVTDPARERDARKEQLRRRFGLTAAEADVAIEIARGDGRKAAAARLGIAVTTARTHLTHIFEKTGVRRQAELVRLILQPGETPMPVRN